MQDIEVRINPQTAIGSLKPKVAEVFGFATNGRRGTFPPCVFPSVYAGNRVTVKKGLTPVRSEGPAHPTTTGAAPLASLMGDLRAVDVSSLSGVSQSTLSRLWDNPRWIERVEGATLSKLMAISPTTGNYVRRWGEDQRLQVAMQTAHAAGIRLRQGAVAHLVRSAPVSAVIGALSAVTEMMQGRHDNASRMYSVCWGQKNNGVMDAILSGGSAAVFEDLDTILTAAEVFAVTTPGFTDLNQIVGYGIVLHKLITHGVTQPRRILDEQNPLTFLTRSSAIARILSENDLSFVEWYRNRVSAHRDLMFMELWSHTTYANDVPIWRRLPKTATLISTAAMTATDIQTRNDAYVYYLLVVALPLLVRMDPRLARHRPSLTSALTAAEEHADGRIRTAAHNIRVSLDLKLQ